MSARGLIWDDSISSGGICFHQTMSTASAEISKAEKLRTRSNCIVQRLSIRNAEEGLLFNLFSHLMCLTL